MYSKQIIERKILRCLEKTITPLAKAMFMKNLITVTFSDRLHVSIRSRAN